ncbi:MAG TPA: leucyl aminopeptidase, partial [Mycobacteriales bacterium]|nr:leucyl aminopeptidase [Mycobacteriales bacterium]
KVATLGSVGVPVVAVVGLGSAPEGNGRTTAGAIRRAAGAATRSLGGRNRVATTLALAAGQPPPAELVAAAGEGALLGAYAFTDYRTSDQSRSAPPSTVAVLVPDPSDEGLRSAAHRASVLVSAVSLARDLVNTAPNDLPPAELARRAEEAGRAAGLEVEVLDEEALRSAGFGGVLGVGSGSSRPPRVVRLRHAGGGPRVALVGKGITFDSGGLSIKPAAGMDHMKSDMAGAAAVIATVVAAAALDLPVEVVATVPMAENLPGGAAYRPADVLTMYGGKRVEVLNTDAEGRLILADAIVRAGEDSPSYLLETSTLTGAQRVALGARTAGVMGSDGLRDRVVAAGERVGEGMWPMPLPEELRRELDSSVADIANVTSDRSGGMLAAGLFLREFVPEGVEWAHVDVAGPAFNTGKPWGFTPKGGTGVPVRTLVAVLEDIADRG